MRRFTIAISLLLSLCALVSSKPTQLQELFHISTNVPINKHIPSLSAMKNNQLLNSLSDFYSDIVEKLADSTITEMISAAPETFQVIHGLQFTGRDHCRTSLAQFMEILEYELEHHVRNTLSSSVQPLVHNLYNSKEQTIDALSEKLSQELEHILQPKQVTNSIISQLYSNKDFNEISIFWRAFKSVTDKTWVETMQHEHNEALALKAWLDAWLLNFGFDLKEEFNSYITRAL